MSAREPMNKAVSLAEAFRAIGFGTLMTSGLAFCVGYAPSWGLVGCAGYGCALSVAVLLRDRF